MTLREAAQQALELIQAQQEWIQAVPDNTPLPTMPGHDGDWAWLVTEKLRQALAQPENGPAITQNLDPLAAFAIEVEMGAWHPDEMAERAAIALKQSKWQVPAPVEAQPESEPSDPYLRVFGISSSQPEDTPNVAQQVAVPQEHLSSLDDVILALRKLELTYGVYNDSKNLKTVRDFLEMLKAAPQPAAYEPLTTVQISIAAVESGITRYAADEEIEAFGRAIEQFVRTNLQK